MPQKLLLAPQVKDSLSWMLSAERVSDERFNSIIGLTKQVFESSQNELQYNDQKRDEFQTLTLSLNILFVELTLNSFTPEQIEQIIPCKNEAEANRLSQIIDSYSSIKQTIVSKFELLRNPRTISSIVECSCIANKIIIDSSQIHESSDTGDIKQDTSLDRKRPTARGQQVIYLVTFKLDNGTFLRIRCDRADLQDLVYKLKEFSSQLLQ